MNLSSFISALPNSEYFSEPTPAFVASFCEKSDWADGEWQTEPDFMLWIDKASNLPCVITRADVFGNLCGYVGVTKQHSLYAKNSANTALEGYCGVNFAGRLYAEFPGNDTIKDVFESADLWWFGFDCCHMHHDLTPGGLNMVRMLESHPNFQALAASTVIVKRLIQRDDATYKNVDFVIAYCQHLASTVPRI